MPRSLRCSSPRTILLATLPLFAGCSWFGGGPSPKKVTSADFYSPTTAPASLLSRVATRPVEPPTDLSAAEPPPARPNTRPAVPLGSYLTVGGVLAEVNGVPIFASKVMRLQEQSLRQDAAHMSEQEFRQRAEEHIGSQVRELVNDEILYAAAQRNLDQNDTKLADALTTDYRQKLILDAGGSLQQARKAAERDGGNFEDLVREENRRILRNLFLYKKVYPRVQVTTEDMRRYYRANLDARFTDHASVEARLLLISPASSGGKAEALRKIRELRDRVTTGRESFATVASATNDMVAFRAIGGLQTVLPNTLNDAKLNAALFDAPVGEVTEIIDDVSGLWIAKIESRTNDKVHAFEDADVQARINNTLRQVQENNLVTQYLTEQRANAIVRQDKAMFDTAIELVDQAYPLWHDAAPKPASPPN